MSKFEKFFTSNKVMITAFVITLIAFAILIVIRSISIVADLQNIFSVAFGVIMFFIAISMYRSFAKHETNAMNIVTGAATGILLISSVQYAVSSLTDTAPVFGVIACVIDAVLYAILLVNHVQINSIHRSTRGRIILNQVILIAMAAYQIFIIISCFVVWVSTPEMMLTWIITISAALSRLFISNMIICIETKLNAYKIDRDAAKAEGSWTDAKKAETKKKYFGK